MNHVSLEQLQRWMLGVITHPRGVAAGMEDAETRRLIPISPAEIEEVVQRSAACNSLERMAVYSHAYFARLMECLRAEYDVLATAAGEEAFASLAAGYVHRNPPTSYTLNRLGARLPQYLEETRPARAPDASGPDWADFLIDLARLERTYAEVFDGPGEEGEPPLSADRLLSVPHDRWGEVHLRLTQSLRLERYRFPVHEYFASVRAGESPAVPAARDVRLAVSRAAYTVRRRELTPEQWTLLDALAAGSSLDAAMEALLATHAARGSALAAQVGSWFREWTREGLIRGAEIPDDT